jgi:hypothetical protein
MRNAEFGMKDGGNSINEEWIVMRVRVGAPPKSPLCGEKGGVNQTQRARG